MSELINFHFLRPAWLLLLLVIPLLWWLLRQQGGGRSAWDRIVDAPLLAYLGYRPAHRRRQGWGWALIAAWVLASTAMSGPSFRQQESAVYRTQSARVLVIDLSRSMLAEDLAPSRLDRARYAVMDLLGQFREGQTGLVAYAGEPFVVSPLTDDARTISAMVGALAPSIMPAPGSEADEALLMAAELIQRVQPEGEILLITDGVDERGVAAARQLAGQGIRTSVIGVGTAEGGPIPQPGGGVVKSADGRIVIPRLDDDRLRQLAAAGNGSYTPLTDDYTALAARLNAGEAAAGVDDADRGRRTSQWQDEGYWLVLLLLPLALIAFRRGLIFVVIGGIGLANPELAAASWEDLWLTRDQQAASALESGDYEKAAEIAEDPMLQGNALYRMGEFEAAANAYRSINSADGQFNLGNALARQQRYEEAIAAYDRALERQPGMEDAEYNRKLIEDLLQQQQEQQQQQQEQDPQQQQEDQQGKQGEAQDEAGDQEADQQPQPQSEAQQSEEESAEQQARELAADDLSDEERQALEQWLRRIPDDPGGLLRRKFMLEYQRRGSPPPREQEDW